MKFKIIAPMIAVLGITSLIVFDHHKLSTPNIAYIEPQYAADFSDDRVLVGASHNIFIGKVVRQVGTQERGIGPETQFEVQVMDNIKGDLKGMVIVDQQGGYKKGILYIVNDADERVRQLRTAYQKEVLLEADVQQNKAYNSYTSLQSSANTAN